MGMQDILMGKANMMAHYNFYYLQQRNKIENERKN